MSSNSLIFSKPVKLSLHTNTKWCQTKRFPVYSTQGNINEWVVNDSIWCLKLFTLALNHLHTGRTSQSSKFKYVDSSHMYWMWNVTNCASYKKFWCDCSLQNMKRSLQCTTLRFISKKDHTRIEISGQLLWLHAIKCNKKMQLFYFSELSHQEIWGSMKQCDKISGFAKIETCIADHLTSLCPP